MKFVRYAPGLGHLLLDTQFGLEADSAGYMSTLSTFGFMGAMTAGVLSDRLFNGRHTAFHFDALWMVAGCATLFWRERWRGVVSFPAAP